MLRLKTLKFIVFIISILSFLNACSNDKGTGSHIQVFDKIKWQIKEGDAYPYRDDMLDDLVSNVSLKGLQYDSLITLLGQPDRIDNGHLFYRVAQKRIGSFPLSTKTFVIKLTPDSSVEWRKIHGG